MCPQLTKRSDECGSTSHSENTQTLTTLSENWTTHILRHVHPWPSGMATSSAILASTEGVRASRGTTDARLRPVRLRPAGRNRIGRSRNWPKSKMTEVEIGRSRTHGVCSFSSFLMIILVFFFFFSFFFFLFSSFSSFFLLLFLLCLFFCLFFLFFIFVFFFVPKHLCPETLKN